MNAFLVLMYLSICHLLKKRPILYYLTKLFSKFQNIVKRCVLFISSFFNFQTKALLVQQLVHLSDILLDGYVTQLNSLRYVMTCLQQAVAKHANAS